LARVGRNSLVIAEIGKDLPVTLDRFRKITRRLPASRPGRALDVGRPKTTFWWRSGGLAAARCVAPPGTGAEPVPSLEKR
jgi:hypothetical protein